MTSISMRATVGNVRELRRFQPAKGLEKIRFFLNIYIYTHTNELVIPLLEITSPLSGEGSSTLAKLHQLLLMQISLFHCLTDSEQGVKMNNA